MFQILHHFLPIANGFGIAQGRPEKGIEVVLLLAPGDGVHDSIQIQVGKEIRPSGWFKLEIIFFVAKNTEKAHGYSSPHPFVGSKKYPLQRIHFFVEAVSQGGGSGRASSPKWIVRYTCDKPVRIVIMPVPPSASGQLDGGQTKRPLPPTSRRLSR